MKSPIAEAFNAAIDRNSPLPYYVQLKDALTAQIERGVWRTGSLIPGEPELCKLFDVSRTVVRQALREMTFEGLIIRRKGKGTFIAAPKIHESLVQKLTGFHQDMIARGITPKTDVLAQELVTASDKVSENLRLAPGAEVIRIDRLRYVDNDPIVFVTTYLPAALCPRLVDVDLSNRSLYAFLEEECDLHLARGRRVIEAVPASEREASLLHVKKGAPLILLESVSYLENGTPLEYYRAFHRGDRSRFEVELVRVRRQQGGRERVSSAEIDLPAGSTVIVDESQARPSSLANRGPEEIPEPALPAARAITSPPGRRRPIRGPHRGKGNT